jgi:type I restriction enzyme R subunit
MLELEDQALKAFRKVLANDYKSVIYKENRDDWRHAEIVVTTVQSLLFNNKYQQLFSPTDFDLVISDEAHRSIGGNARAVFDYFIGYKLGLTATPRDYLKKFNKHQPTTRDPREFERRLLLDTYRTFGCDDGQPTFRYSLLEGVKDGFLINPTVVDARSEVTTQLLSDDGFVVEFKDDGDDQKETYKQREFEKRFFSDATNQLFCKTFLEHALRDPVSGEIGKSIVFAVSQNHAAKLAHALNLMADKMFPGKYQSDFAVQVTSQIPDAQQFTINFTNNNLLGSANFLPAYKTSKARVCVTVGMMTTGYDCPDILNLGLFRPIFSPTDFIQIKGRGTRKHDFREQLFDETIKESVKEPKKTALTEFYTLDKLRKAAAVDRRLTLREILEKIFGLIPRFKSKDELLEEEFTKFVADYKPDEAEAIPAIKTYFKAYVTDGRIRHIIDEKEFADLATNPVFSTKDFKTVPAKYRTLIPDYIKDYVSLNQFAA